MKRSLLPLRQLRVLDVAGRHTSFVAAANELGVTPAAVGQHIQMLEDHLGVLLFRRTNKGLELTTEGFAGLALLREGFLKFEECVRGIQADKAPDVYTIACPPDFFSRYLAPRLAAFSNDQPHTRYELVAEGGVDFLTRNLDIAIRLAEGPGKLEGVQLAPVQHVVVVGRNATANAHKSWIDWSGAPFRVAEEATVCVSDAEQALASVVAGMGKAIMPYFLAEEKIKSNCLQIVEGPTESSFAYWLVAPQAQWRQKKVRALVEFLTTGPSRPSMRSRNACLVSDKIERAILDEAFHHEVSRDNRDVEAVD